jgi:cell division protein FtsZ
MHIGRTTTRGLGSGMDPAVGRKAAEESQNDIREMLKGTDMIFITAGAGGGTGSGASPVIADIAKEMGILTVAVVTKPFSFEGGPRRQVAEEALRELSKRVDTLITIPNDRIWQIIDKKTPLLEAFQVVDEVLRQGVQGISELITLPGLINVDFADVRTIMHSSGSALMGMGIANGDNRAVEAAKAAISSPLLELSIDGAKGILFTITGGPNLTMYEVSEAAKIITESVDSDARIIFGAVVNPEMKEDIKVTVVATGFTELMTKDNLLRVHQPAQPLNYFQAKPREDLSPAQAQKSVNRIDEPVRVEDPRRAVFQATPPQMQPATMGQSATHPVEDTESDEEDLEIPAFIRKKMM